MKIGIIDCEIIGKNKHRFPNLCSMKISAYHKSIGDSVALLLDYDHLNDYDKVYISKVFIKTNLPNEPKNSNKTEENCHLYYADNSILNAPNVIGGGTGFYYDKAEPLPDYIEHMMPDYHLYDEWIEHMINQGAKQKDFFWYTDYSIGYLTRGCFRKCPFCVNRKYNHAFMNANVNEFYDKSRPKLCFLDDNFFSSTGWKGLIEDVKALKRPFQFKQGLDERLLDEEKINELLSWKYDGNITLAFDNYEDKALIVEKLELLYKIRPDFKKQLRFYIFCGYDRNGIYDEQFWLEDISSIFERCYILAKYSCLPYLQRHENVYNTKYHGIYTTIGRWINRPSLYKSMSFYKSSCLSGMEKNYHEWKNDIEGWIKSDCKKYSSYNYMTEFLEMSKTHKQLGNKYFYITPKELSKYGGWCKNNK